MNFFFWISCRFCRSWHPSNIMLSKQTILAERSSGSDILFLQNICRYFRSWHQSAFAFFINFPNHPDQEIFFFQTSCRFCWSWHPNDILLNKQAIPADRLGRSGIYFYEMFVGLSSHDLKCFCIFFYQFSHLSRPDNSFFQTSYWFCRSWHPSDIMLSKQAIPAERSDGSDIYFYRMFVGL